MDRSKTIFGNEVSEKEHRKAIRSKEKFIKRFGDDSGRDHPAKLTDNEYLLGPLGVRNIRIDEGRGDTPFDLEKGIIVGNIRMGFGHYRIAIAMASAAHSMGLEPYWMDLNSYPDTTCTKVIGAQNDLYSMGSRLSRKSALFDKLFWEPMNYEGFRKLSYNASDQKNAELMAPVFANIPKELPFIGTHVWPSQAAIHAGMRYVVNAIPDNWPMALHLAEGSVHTIQTHQAYMGYRILNGMRGSEVLQPMPADKLVYTGHYVDHELVSNLTGDCEARVKRQENNEPMRFLLTIGGAGAQQELFSAVIAYLIPYIRDGRASLYVNVGDYRKVWDSMLRSIPGLAEVSVEHFNKWDETADFCSAAVSGPVRGVHAFWHENIFPAVYCTNLLMRSSDVLLTKPSELAFYPVPKIFLQRIGGHEKWGAIHSAEIGDGTLECEDTEHTLQMAEMFLEQKDLLKRMCENILANKTTGVYDGAYKVVEIAESLKNKG